MSSILIKGMELPEHSGRSEMPELYSITLKVYPNGNAEAYRKGSYEKHDIALVPTPHGRLIDADAIMDLLEKSVPEKNRGHQFYVFRHMLRNAPTVIEAEGTE